jgi:hypothetical protein
VTVIVGRRRVGLLLAALLSLALGLVAVAPARAQSFSAADLEGTWELFQLATPKVGGNSSTIRSYRGQVTFDATGVVSDLTAIVDDLGNAFVPSGNFSVSTVGVVAGKLTLTGTAGAPTGDLTLREARLLINRHTILGAAGVFGQVGLFTLVKDEAAQAFGFADIGGATSLDWSYSELTPSNGDALSLPGGIPAWVSGGITFHGPSDALPGCTDADLTLSDGTVLSARGATPGQPFG